MLVLILAVLEMCGSCVSVCACKREKKECVCLCVAVLVLVFDVSGIYALWGRSTRMLLRIACSLRAYMLQCTLQCVLQCVAECVTVCCSGSYSECVALIFSVLHIKCSLACCSVRL